MTRIFRLSIIFVFAVLLLTGITSAQQVSEPPLLLVDGDIYLWDGAVAFPITNSGYAFDPAVSPDGSLVAYVEYADFVIDFFDQEGGVGGGALPSDIRIYNLNALGSFPVTEQPAGASLVDTDADTIARGAPVWSPDGDMLAWTDTIFTRMVPNGVVDYIVTYDLSENRIRRITGLPPQAGIPAPVTIRWGETGIIAWSIGLGPNDEFIDTLLIYDENGRQTGVIPVPPRGGDDYISDFVPVDFQGTEYIAVIYGSGEVALFTPQEEGSTIAPGVLQAYSLLNPGGVGLSVYLEGGFGSPFVAEIDDGSGTLLPVGYRFSDIAISPRADRYVYLVDGGAVVTGGRGDTFIPAPGDGFITNLTWAPLGWRIDATFTPPSSEEAAQLAGCNLTPRLTTGDEGYVLPGPANRLRTQPNTDSAVITNIPGEAFFTVLDGPVCNQGFVWWEVQYGDLFGWTAEGADGEYYLAPAPAG